MSKIIRFLDRRGIYTNVSKSMYETVMDNLPSDSYIYENSVYNKSTNKWDYNISDKYFDITFFSDIHHRHGMFVCHGIADKKYRDANLMALFDYVCVPGLLWEEKLISQGLNKNKIKILGYPKMDKLFTKNRVIHNDGKIHVLYAPTHNTKPNNMQSTSSYPRLLNEIDKLKDDRIEIKHSFHPANAKQEITMDLLLWADVVISDSGSLVYESWALDIPVIFPDWLVKQNIFNYGSQTFESHIYRENIGYHANNIGEMKQMILKAYDEGLDKKTTHFIDGIFSKSLRGCSGKAIADEILKRI